MNGGFTERRRRPRVTLASGVEFQLERTSPVQVLDVGLTGVLLAVPGPVGGHDVEVRTRLGGQPFTARLEVCRQEPDGQRPGRSLVGARFAGLDEAAARRLREFLAGG